MNTSEVDVIAIFHSIEGMSHYQVEIKQDNQSYFISEQEMPTTFGNMELAKKAAVSHKAVKGYMQLSSASDEMIDQDPAKENKSHADLLPVSL
jgi:hypothetical protein